LGRFRRFGRFGKFEVKVKGEGEQRREFPLPSSPFPVPQIFVSLRDGSKSRFVSAASDETRQGETEMDAPLKAKPLK
jgi:hypothetical protein